MWSPSLPQRYRFLFRNLSSQLLLWVLLWSGSPALSGQVLTPNLSGADSLYLAAYEAAIRGRDGESTALLVRGMETFPADARFPRMLASRYFDAGETVKARSLYETMAAGDSSDITAWMRLGELDNFSQDYPRAMNRLHQVLATDSLHLGALLLLGDILERLEQSSARTYYERAWRHYPGNQKVGYALGNLYIQQKEPVKSIPVCERILAVDSTSIRFRKLLGYAFYKSNDPAGAVLQFNIANDLGDSTKFTYKFLGIGHYLLSNFSEAVRSLEKAAERDSTDAEVHFFLGSSLATTTRKREAMEHLETSVRLMQPDPGVLARIYSEEGNLLRLEMKYEEAYERYRLARDSNPADPTALYFMASILDNSLHRSKEALVDYRAFLDALDNLPAENLDSQSLTLRGIVEERIVSLREELFFTGELDPPD
ncbi:MAG: tetratricopeptide repeat protein [Bacteroidales bacterium]